jgi:hypothetical protein
MHKSRAPGRSGEKKKFVRRLQYLCVLSMQFASCHPSGGRNFAVAFTFLKGLCAHVLRNKNKFMCLKLYLNSD